jgi:hypothetical protein
MDIREETSDKTKRQQDLRKVLVLEIVKRRVEPSLRIRKLWKNVKKKLHME